MLEKFHDFQNFILDKTLNVIINNYIIYNLCVHIL